MSAAVVTDPRQYLDYLTPERTFDELRRLQGGLQLRRGQLEVERDEAETLRERFDLAHVIAFYDEAIAQCRDAIALKRRRAGWPEYRRPPRPATPGGGSPRPVHAQSALPRCPGTGQVAARLGVAGALPPPLTGHGWPAVSRAGSAAAGSDRSPDAVAPPSGAAAHPAKPAFFCPENERISNENNNVGGIHYAHIQIAHGSSARAPGHLVYAGQPDPDPCPAAVLSPPT